MNDPEQTTNLPPRSGIIALVGRANVGKSTLVNRILGEKVSIVSDVAQTTRNLIRAIWTEGRGQLVFLDTPGVHKAKHDLGRIMNQTARAAAEGTDVCLLVVDCSSRPRDEDEGWMCKLSKTERPAVLGLNKRDLGGKFLANYREMWEEAGCSQTAEEGPRSQIRRRPEAMAGQGAPASGESCLEISASTGDGVDALVDLLFSLVPEGPPLFPGDILTDFPRKLNIGDVVREKLFAVLQQELPHAVAVRVNSIAEDEAVWEVEADILVNRPSQKGIVIGKKGRLLKRVCEQAEAELAEMYGHPVRLHLWVRVEKDWSKNFWVLKELGYA